MRLLALTVQPSIPAVQPSFSTIRCKTLNIFIKVCYALPVVTAMPPRRSPSTFPHLIPTPILLAPKSYGIISFTDPHPLTLLKSYRFKNRVGGGCSGRANGLHPKFLRCNTYRPPRMYCKQR